MTSKLFAENAQLQSLTSDTHLDSRLMLPKGQSINSSPSLDASVALRSSREDEEEFNKPPSLPSASPDSTWRQRAKHDLSSRTGPRSPSASARSLSAAPSRKHHDEPRQVILSSFAPRVACFASADTEQFVISKGFNDGLRGLLRPFGEHIQGKVVIRDSVGASRGWEDFGIRFVQFNPIENTQLLHESVEANSSLDESNQQKHVHFDDPLPAIDEVMEHYLNPEGELLQGTRKIRLDFSPSLDKSPKMNSSAYLLYLRTLLSSMPIVPYETFAHPVACIIAVSSRNPSPIDSLRQLYEDSSQGAKEIHSWVKTEFLRYYVLIHDEENDDIIKSTALFDLMKRHFGLHCHLLRLRGSQCVQTDDDSVQVPQCEWISAGEELAQIRSKDRLDDVETDERYIHESDANAIRSFLREMVIQSVVPFMEGRVTAWNDQVASRRRGIGGRFMSLSKRFVGLGASKSVNPGRSDSPGPSIGSYDAIRGFYSPESTEAMMRQLADHAFMLRDWKLAYNTYEILRTDFGNDKAWKYHAAANEMAAISILLMPQSVSSRARSESLDQMLEVASYSYLTRCSLSFGAVRCLTVAMELLKSRGSIATADAAKWGGKLLELCVLSPIGQGFLSERIADCYHARPGAGSLEFGSRKRQTALWNLLASATWIGQGNFSHARDLLRLASNIYQRSDLQGTNLPFPNMFYFWGKLEKAMPTENRVLITSDNDMMVKSIDQESAEQVDYERIDEFRNSINRFQLIERTNSVFNTSQINQSNLH